MQCSKRSKRPTLGLMAGNGLRQVAPCPEGQGNPMSMKIVRAGSNPSAKGPPEQFTGTVRRDPMFTAEAPGRVQAGINTFEAGARTVWHTHPFGQILFVTQGLGRVQVWGGPFEEIRPGDVVWFPAGVKHWHGASPKTAMTHMAITETLDGEAVKWLEPVTDEQYGR